MKYIKVFFSIIIIFLGSTLLNTTVDNELMVNIIMKTLGGLMMLMGVVIGGRVIKKSKLKSMNN